MPTNTTHWCENPSTAPPNVLCTSRSFYFHFELGRKTKEKPYINLKTLFFSETVCPNADMGCKNASRTCTWFVLLEHSFRYTNKVCICIVLVEGHAISVKSQRPITKGLFYGRLLFWNVQSVWKMFLGHWSFFFSLPLSTNFN